MANKVARWPTSVTVEDLLRLFKQNIANHRKTVLNLLNTQIGLPNMGHLKLTRDEGAFDVVRKIFKSEFPFCEFQYIFVSVNALLRLIF